MEKYEDIEKLARIKLNFKRKCEYCGTSTSFYAFEKDKKICRTCNRTIYRNDLIKFKDKLKKEIK